MDHSHTSRRPSRSFVRLLNGGGYGGGRRGRGGVLKARRRRQISFIRPSRRADI